VKAAFTSIVGDTKFASGYGLSRHAAAVATCRRGLGFGERLRSRSALPLPRKTRGRHVRSDWGRLSRRLRAERARGRRLSEGSHGRGHPYPRHPLREPKALLSRGNLGWSCCGSGAGIPGAKGRENCPTGVHEIFAHGVRSGLASCSGVSWDHSSARMR